MSFFSKLWKKDFFPLTKTTLHLKFSFLNSLFFLLLFQVILFLESLSIIISFLIFFLIYFPYLILLNLWNFKVYLTVMRFEFQDLVPFSLQEYIYWCRFKNPLIIKKCRCLRNKLNRKWYQFYYGSYIMVRKVINNSKEKLPLLDSDLNIGSHFSNGSFSWIPWFSFSLIFFVNCL
jgi:hypothetical protein